MGGLNVLCFPHEGRWMGGRGILILDDVALGWGEDGWIGTPTDRRLRW